MSRVLGLCPRARDAVGRHIYGDNPMATPANSCARIVRTQTAVLSAARSMVRRTADLAGPLDIYTPPRTANSPA